MFVTKLNPAGSALVYSTYLGGNLNDEGVGIAVDSAGNAYVTGFTNSANFPTTADAVQTAHGGGFIDTFLTKVNPSGSMLVYSTYLGGNGQDDGRAIALDAAGNAYVAGSTASNNFPTTVGALDRSFNSGGDVYVAKFLFNQPPVADAGLDQTVSL
ncbi:MAG: SBBP repeat-containing protein [Acidobacteria bacterium]|nr:SBBP repeat-containing protein [Acidobacteriota bacterium]